MNEILGDGRGYVGRSVQQVDDYIEEAVIPVRKKYADALSIKSEVEV
jgi:hypothetical protein